ncbi:FERM domain-containing protein 4B isoform X3 [Bactrocera tryoni]|uniref:FERM domain-containing protein 4B isoform X3 n=1 Tax=Bactrocera tryoni TaxID=59916 RepID=UPI001A96F78F|nr:FERM domain-containing protein 4B isoform X3 [Bactrocera tryoni]
MFKKKTEIGVHKCIVRLFEDFNAVEYEFLDTHKGSYLMDRLCQRLEIKEKDYFGLRFVDNTKQRQWLDLGKLIIKQCKDIHHLIFSFRVKFYPADPFHLSLNVRVLLYKQLKRDLNHGRIYCSSNEIVTLGALIVQDYDENIHTGDYLSNLRLSARQTDAIEKKIIKKHRERTPGQDPIIVINEFLRITRNLETYGTEPHYVKDHQGVQMYIGINFSGISAFISGKRTQHFLWNDIRKLNFEGKMFIAHIGYMDTSREIFSISFYAFVIVDQLTLKRKKFNISGCYNSEASFSKQQVNNLSVDGNDVFNMLKTISPQLEELSSRVGNMEKKMDSSLKENIIHKSEEMAQQKIVHECKVLIRKVHQLVCRLTGQEIDNTQTKIAFILPLTTLSAALKMGERLKSEEFAKATVKFILRMKGIPERVCDVLRHLHTDEFLILCNWDGRGGKQPLSKSLLSNILYDPFITCGFANFEQQIRKSIKKSHHRYKQKNIGSEKLRNHNIIIIFSIYMYIYNNLFI